MGLHQSQSGQSIPQRFAGTKHSYTRNLSEHFGLAFDGGSYRWDVSATNEGSPTVDLFLAGPVFRAGLFEKIGGFAHVLIGGAHTGGVAIQPDVSFAGGVDSAWTTIKIRAGRFASTAMTSPHPSL